MNEAYEVCRDAILKDELKDYLLNRGYYKRLPDKYDDNLEPDTKYLLRGIHTLYEKERNAEYVKKFTDIILEMLNSDVYELKYALLYLQNQILFQHKKIATFKINEKEILNVMKNVLLSRKNELENSMLNEKKNAWEFVENVNSYMDRTFNSKII